VTSPPPPHPPRILLWNLITFRRSDTIRSGGGGVGRGEREGERDRVSGRESVRALERETERGRVVKLAPPHPQIAQDALSSEHTNERVSLPAPSHVKSHSVQNTVLCLLSSYNKVYSVMYGSWSVPRRTIFFPRETSRAFSASTQLDALGRQQKCDKKR